MSIYLSILSLLKQKLYCNVEKIIYLKVDKYIPNIFPKIAITYKVISDINDLKKYSDDKEFKNNILKFKFFLNHNSRIYLAMYNKSIVGHYMVCKLSDFKPSLYLNNILFSRDNIYYIFFCRTFEKFQGKKIFSYMLTQIYQDIVENYEEVFISTDTNNIASQKAIGNAGFKKLGILNYKQIACINYINNFKNSTKLGVNNE